MKSDRTRSVQKTMAVVAIVALVGTPAAAIAWDQNIAAGWNHFAECFGYMINDEAAHEAQCSPGFEFFGSPAGDFGTTDPDSSSLSTSYSIPD